MAKWLCIIIAILIMFPFGMNEEKEMEKDVSIGNFNGNMQFYSCHSSHANYSPVALMKEYCYEGIVGKAIVFDASSSYDPNGDALMVYGIQNGFLLQ